MKIEDFISTHGLKQNHLAELLGISNATFTKKMQSRIEYGFTEAQRQTIIDYIRSWQTVELR
ncbi:helix-turn-helix transcriptional regulator [Solirubrum puertoriconensis]|uniref:Uncharacterized protein n=1 Tax=Solirubrum puertoriconensis TaxID=1751427 RepID=A0A9X0L4B5_SOLP1|nr:helix-turn-helix transcriptional regulator [Solirubrum puertoriconensis]KUG07435.1 hypothetical protein ASU33_13865 [Solirubrum puertoriconensis]